MAILATKEETATRTTLEIEVPAEDVEKAFAAVTKSYVKRAAIPGFRKGKAPVSVIQKRFSDEIKGDVLEAIVPDALAAAIEERKLAVLGRPHIDELKWDPPGPIRFEAKLDLKPPVDPGEYKGIPVEDQPVEPTDEEVSKVVERIREAHAEFHPVEGRPAAKGDFAVADIAGSFVEILAPGQNPRTFRDEKITLEVGHEDSMAEVNDALRGAAVGETRSFRKTFADDFPNDEFKGKTVDYQVTLAALKEKKLPALDDEFAGAVAEGDTLATLREKVRDPAAPREGSRPQAQVPPGHPRRPALAARDPGPRGPRRVRDRRGAARLRALPRAERRRPREGRLGEAADRGPPRGGEARPRVPAARRHRPEGRHRDHRDGARGRVQAGRRAARGRARGPAGADGQGGRHRIPARRDAPVPGRRPLD